MIAAAVYVPQRDTLSGWVDMLGGLLPGWRVTSFDDVTDPADVDYAIVWRPQPGCLARFPNLKAIVSIGAGIDHVLADPELPKDVPVIRTVGEDLTQRMLEYVALHVLRHHRDMPRQLQAQAELDWHSIVVPTAPNRIVGVMGLGNLGAAAARVLSQIGFATRGWAKSPKSLDGIETHFGADGLNRFLDNCEILVNLLPLTPETEGILDADQPICSASCRLVPAS